jgi:hypothetical protein
MRAAYLNVFHAPIGSQPLSNQGTVFVRPVLMELFFGQPWVPFCADSNAYELIDRHRGINKQSEMVLRWSLSFDQYRCCFLNMIAQKN